MARIKYYYDTETCKYERVKVSSWDIFLNLLGFLTVALILAIGILLGYNTYFDSPKEALLKKENEELNMYYELLKKDMNETQDMLASLQNRDDQIYRVIFEAEPIPSSIREAGVGGANRYKEMIESDLQREELIVESFKKLDKLKKQMYIQTKSFDEIMKLAKNKEELWAATPAIQPISNKELKRLASGFGIRIDPILKTSKMHAGVDFSAERGTPIYATGDGVIKSVRYDFGGYGKYVVIDHGFGYETLYGHMDLQNVKVGQRVKRGETIGFVGSTGKSTAPHVHYEVHINGKAIDPVHYFFQGVTPEEYEEILRLASVENQSLG
jgi:murein DD-endopeptidase MepM/ murein hydrolase activator NlpD